MGNMAARMAARTSTKADPFDPEFYSRRNDRWLTPLTIIGDLGPFDLDPCAAPDHPTASTRWTPEEVGDGLSMPWFGRVWLNPPYGRTMGEWVRRLAEHGSGVALIPVTTGTRLWQDIVFPNATAILFYRHRINFLRREGLDTAEEMVAPQASALIAFSAEDAARLAKSKLQGECLQLTSQPDVKGSDHG